MFASAKLFMFVADFVLLRKFLLRCKNSMEKTKQKIESYFISVGIMSDIFAQLDPRAPGIKECLLLL